MPQKVLMGVFSRNHKKLDYEIETSNSDNWRLSTVSAEITRNSITRLKPDLQNLTKTVSELRQKSQETRLRD